MDLNTIRASIRVELEQTNTLIRDSLDSKIKLIPQLGGYITQSGGKQIRPILSILAAQSQDYQGFQHIKLAAIVELIHTSTLLHDDVVDHSVLRRGQQTANAVFGNAASVLVGDFLYSQAFQLMAEMEHLSVIKVLASTTKSLAEGEVLQLTNSRNCEINEASYRQTIYCKTASLFEAVTQLGAMLAQTGYQQEIALKDYGRHLGMAFQITDDLLDYSADDAILGKNVGDDLAEGKVTLPIIYALTQASANERHIIHTAIEQGQSDEIEAITSILHKTGALAYTKQQAKQEAELALEALSIVPNSPAKQALQALARISIERKY
tara:strand:- start:12208 stop:13176 length:969 start_codon:yes stop_codon:yes gene_type:complete